MAGAQALTGPALDRRLFLGLAGAAAIARPAAASRKRNRLIVNALGGLSNPNDREEGEQGEGRSIEKRVIDDIRASGCDAINITLGYVAGPDEPFEATVADIGKWDARIRNHPRDLLKILAAADILRARDEGRIGLIYGFQNAAMLGDKAERADIFHDLGVRIVQLTYNPANALGDGSMAPLNRGLTDFGRKAIERLNARRIMVDLSHSGERTCLEAARASKQPISINHTGCRALTDLPRNKTDEELRLVASRGGFVGIYFMPFLSSASNASATDVVAHIDHAVNVCGEDHVGIGTDGPVTGVDDMAAYRLRAAREVAKRKAAGIGATGENPDTIPMVADLQGPGQFDRLVGLLRAKGYREGRIDKILGLNFLSFARRVWGA
ncbi:MAG TPA: membrane dipeptidase [Allosphingosinicella sp.]